MQQPNSRSRYIMYAVLSSTLSSVATVFKVQGVQTVPPLLAATVGVLFGGVVAFCYLLIRRQVPKFSDISKVRRPLAMLILCRPVISNLLFTIGLSMTTGIKAVFLTKMEPYLVIFWVWILDGKRPSTNHLLLLVVHVIGAVLLSAGDAVAIQDAQWGDLLIVSGVVTAALSYRYAPQVTKVLTPLQTATVAETAGGLLTVPLALAFCSIQLEPAQQIGWAYIAAHSILFYVFAITFLYASLDGIDGWLSSALRATGPLLAAPVAWIFFDERLTALQLLGAALVLITSGLISRNGKAKPRKMILPP